MTDYLRNEREAIFRGHRVAVFVSSSPSGERRAISSAISGIAALETPRELCFVVSPQLDEDGEEESVECDDPEDDDGDGRGDDARPDHDDRRGIAARTVETIDFDDELDTEAIDVVVLSTKTWRVVHDDSFVNDFLRRTDAWIHMGSEFGDDFCYYARLQEGANITLW